MLKINKWGRKRENTHPSSRVTTDVEGTVELENHHFTTITVIDSAKNYQLILELVGESLMRNWIFT